MKNEKKQNPYHKCCPHCQKEFKARRLNQKYCTYFCKVQFNNERARLRRLELLAIVNKNQESNPEKTSSATVVQETTIASHPSKTVEKKTSIDTLNWRNIFTNKVSYIPKWMYFLLGLSALTFFISKYKRRKNSTPNFTEYIPQNEPDNQIDVVEENDQSLYIPTEIYSVKSNDVEKMPLTKNTNEEEGDFFEKINTHFKEGQPDVERFKEILTAHGLIKAVP